MRIIISPAKKMKVQPLTPAILSYEGIQYQYMAPTVFEEQMITCILGEIINEKVMQKALMPN